MLHVHIPEIAGAEEEWPLVQAAATRMTSRAQHHWRWRLLYCRALLDAELTANDRCLTDRCFDIFRELTDLYYAEHAVPGLKPPAREAEKEWQKLWD